MTINDSAISEQGMCEEEQVARIAWFYYHDGLTQSEISDRLGLTRLKVSRLLEKGHQSGIIRVQINSRFEGCLEYETQLRRQFSLQHVRVIPGLADADVGGRLGIGAAHMLMSLLQPQQMLAIGFGEATMNTLQRLSGFISSQQIRLVTLSGGVGSYMTGIGQLNAACSVNIIPAPLRASSADIARTLKNENCVKDVLLAAQAADVAIVGIGAVCGLKAGTPVVVGGGDVQLGCLGLGVVRPAQTAVLGGTFTDNKQCTLSEARHQLPITPFRMPS